MTPRWRVSVLTRSPPTSMISSPYTSRLAAAEQAVARGKKRRRREELKAQSPATRPARGFAGRLRRLPASRRRRGAGLAGGMAGASSANSAHGAPRTTR
eukprot:7274142-Prymnesium_polylepis.1